MPPALVRPDGPRWQAHVAVTAWFALLAVWVSYPLILNPGGLIPGAGPEDNLSFLWNFWWFRYALTHPGQPLFETSHLFAPFGTSLVLHTHTALPALVGATVLGWMPLVAAHTTMLLAGLAANGVATYGLAYYHVRRVLPAVLAGVIFASSVFVTIRLLGHFNLVHAWVCPLAMLAWIALLDRPSLRRGALTGVAFSAVIWSDYYYAVFCGLFAIAWWVGQVARLDIRWAGRRFPRLEWLLLSLAAVTGIALAAALLTDSVQFRLLGTRISISNTRNPIAILWVLSLVGLLLRVRLTPQRRAGEHASRTPTPLRVKLSAFGAAVVVGTVLTFPLASAAAQLFKTGNYVTPPRHWQSGPQGIDVLTVLLGNPAHSVYGAAIQRLYRHAGIDLIEQALWLGIVPLVAIAILAADKPSCAGAASRWMWIGGLFLTWSAGAYLIVAGFDTGLPLPQALAHYVPVLSNARIPGRAVMMVQLAAAVLCAIVAARREWKASTIFIAMAIVIVDNAAVPIPMYRLPPAGSIERVLGTDPAAGSVFELPAGVRDGLSAMGFVDHRALWFQTIHGRPIVGGFTARVSDRIKAAYAADATLVALIEQRELAIPPDLAVRLAPHGIRFVVLNRDKTSREFREALQRSDLVFVMADADRELYLVR
jgi:hypothetical protein